MRGTGLGRILFGLSFAAIGVLIIVSQGFARAWEAVPKHFAAHDSVAIAFGALLLVGGIALFVPRAAGPAALLITALLLLRLLALHIPRIAAHPLVEGMWESMGENLIFLAGAWTIFANVQKRKDARGSALVRAGQILFALALIPIGLSHFFYLGETAPLIPSWLPFHVPLAYFTGAAWLAAGIGILFGVLPRLAVTLAAAMAGLFTVLVWVPMLIAAPSSRANWAEICTSAAITAAAWVVAESFRAQTWSFASNVGTKADRRTRAA